jgi:hypothetical protein
MADVVFVVDCTSNLAYFNYIQYVLGFMQTVVLNLDDTGRMRVAAISFNEIPKVGFPGFSVHLLHVTIRWSYDVEIALRKKLFQLSSIE